MVSCECSLHSAPILVGIIWLDSCTHFQQRVLPVPTTAQITRCRQFFPSSRNSVVRRRATGPAKTVLRVNSPGVPFRGVHDERRRRQLHPIQAHPDHPMENYREPDLLCRERLAVNSRSFPTSRCGPVSEKPFAASAFRVGGCRAGGHVALRQPTTSRANVHVALLWACTR